MCVCVCVCAGQAWAGPSLGQRAAVPVPGLRGRVAGGRVRTYSPGKSIDTHTDEVDGTRFDLARLDSLRLSSRFFTLWYAGMLIISALRWVCACLCLGFVCVLGVSVSLCVCLGLAVGECVYEQV